MVYEHRFIQEHQTDQLNYQDIAQLESNIDEEDPPYHKDEVEESLVLLALSYSFVKLAISAFELL